MRHGGDGKGVFSGDYTPPLPWRIFNVRMKNTRTSTDRSVGALTDAELQWVLRTALAECEARVAARSARRAANVAGVVK